MPSLEERQQAFAAALLDPERPVPKGLVGPDGRPSLKRFNVYRNNVVAGLTATLKDAFPAVARIVGEEFFLAMGRIYVATEPPTSPIMLDYGKGFPGFIQGFAPVAGLPYLADVACIERAWVEAYHTADVEPLEAIVFAQISASDLPHVRVTLHPSLRIVRSEFPSLTIWQMNLGDAVPTEIDLEAGGENAFILRSGADVEVRALPTGAAEFIAALAERHSMIEAMKQAMTADPRFDLSACLSGLMAARVFAGFDIPPVHPGQREQVP
ncbi:MAG: putative DNA-binding domain-containing protein [Rhizobiaceae bacterium]|nr:putative DNA-binding domain-containing protein [Rhizobiaceae bacterium]